MTPQEELAQYIDWVLEHDSRAWAESGTEAAAHIVNVLGWRPPREGATR
jgi:hypothetical protein